MDEVAAAIAAKGYEHVSAGYIWALRRGERDNPTIKTVEALADFFGVPPGYFLDNDEELVQRVDSQLGLLTKIRDAGIENLAMRAAELSPESREAVARLIDAMAHMIDTVATNRRRRQKAALWARVRKQPRRHHVDPAPHHEWLGSRWGPGTAQLTCVTCGAGSEADCPARHRRQNNVSCPGGNCGNAVTSYSRT